MIRRNEVCGALQGVRTSSRAKSTARTWWVAQAVHRAPASSWRRSRATASAHTVASLSSAPPRSTATATSSWVSVGSAAALADAPLAHADEKALGAFRRLDQRRFVNARDPNYGGLLARHFAKSVHDCVRLCLWSWLPQ